MNNNVTSTGNGDFKVEYVKSYPLPLCFGGRVWYHNDDPYKPDGAISSVNTELPDGYIWVKYDYSSRETDNVNHPSHYTKGKIECIEVIAQVTEGLEGMEAVDTAQIFKYVWRWKHKNGLEDLRKAKWYLEDLIKRLEK